MSKLWWWLLPVAYVLWHGQHQGYAVLLVVVWLVWTYKGGVRLPGKAAAGCGFASQMAKAAGGAANVKGGNHTSKLVATHEAGHVAVVRVVSGIRVTNVQVGSNWGFVSFNRWHKDPVMNIAMLLGGEIAAGSSSGCGYDRSVAKSFLKKIPKHEQAAAMRKARSIATSAVGFGSSVSSDAKKILKTGGI